MPVFQPEALRRSGGELFEAAGCPPEDAHIVVDHLVEPNLFGHDSHGAIRFYQYTRGLGICLCQARTNPQVIREGPCNAIVDGQGDLGPIGATFTTKLAIEKAEQQGLAAVALRNTSHTGRVGAYPLITARDGLVDQIFVHAGHHEVFVAPFRGIDGGLSTNPIAFCAPGRRSDHVEHDHVRGSGRQDLGGCESGQTVARGLDH